MTLRGAVSYALRLAVTLGAIALAFRQIDLDRLWPLLLHLPPLTLAATLIVVHAGQACSAWRTRIYLFAQGIALSLAEALRLHYIGGLFNLFLPGGAGGDVYKAWWLKRHKEGRLVSMVKVMVSTRLNGLWALGVVICLLALVNPAVCEMVPYGKWLLIAALPLGTVFYALVARFALREPYKLQWAAAPWSMAVQGLLVVAAWLLAMGVGIEQDRDAYVLLFMLSCMLAMLPISIGGIGVRELAVLHGTRMLGLSEESGVALAFGFTVINLSIPLVGAMLHLSHHRKVEAVL